MTRAAKRSWSHIYEHRTHPVLAWPAFLRRAGRHLAWGLLLVAIVVAVGMAGYHWFAGLQWVDAFLNASMILSGMGPVDRLPDDSAKLFASVFALFSGLFFVAVVGVITAPWIHRLLHVMHADEGG